MTPGEGFKVVSVQFGDAAGNWSENYTAGIELMVEPPPPQPDNNIPLVIRHAMVDFKKKADDDKLRIEAYINPQDLVDL